MGGFYIVWLDDEGDPIAETNDEWLDEWIDRTSLENAVRAVALRLRQSPHICPPNVAGFYVIPGDKWESKNQTY